MKHVVLSNEDFQDFPIGEFPYDKDHTAMGEYQYVVENGYHGNWVDMVCNYTYNGTGPTWLITERDGRHFMESMRIEKNRPHRMFPTLGNRKAPVEGLRGVRLRQTSFPEGHGRSGIQHEPQH